MTSRAGPGDGFTVLDGAALVIGSAIAAVHVRAAAQPAEGLDLMGWTLLWVVLIGVALTAAGPIVFVVRRYGRRPPGYPQTGDRLWAVLGTPWLLAAPVRDEALGILLLEVGTAIASMASLAVLWQTRVVVPPARARARAPTTWTAKVGMILAITWPLQAGFVLAVVG
ncbi:MAG: hypothetical protein ABI353_23910 [Isosphaeraceae bacterium]